MSQQDIIPVYLVTGFLESGKTTLIRSMLEDKNFTRGQRTLIIACEEGVEELEGDLLDDSCCTYASLESVDELTPATLRKLNEEYKPERVIMEYNSVWTIEKLGQTPIPAKWRVVQCITMVDATTFDNYLNNMRKIITDPMKEADLVMFNRCKEEHPKSAWRRMIRALNPNCDILFENSDGSTEDGIADEDLPYDMKADIIDITDEDLGIFYIDSLDHPQRYDGKTVRFVGQAFKEKGLPNGYYYFGRLAMTCCANDIAQIGWVTKGDVKPGSRRFVKLTARCSIVETPEQPMLMFTELHTEQAAAPKEKYITFGNA